MVAQMPIVSGGSGFAFAFALAALCLDGRTAHAPASPVPYCTSGCQTGYGVHAGVEFRPTSNLSLSLGVGYTQQPAGYDTGINSLAPPGASSFAFGGRR